MAHWIEDEAARKRFWAWAKGLGLDEDAIHSALRVSSVKEFAGSKEEAKALIQEAADMAQLAPQEPGHGEARMVAFTPTGSCLVAPCGVTLAITAREGATADTIVATALQAAAAARRLLARGWTVEGTAEARAIQELGARRAQTMQPPSHPPLPTPPPLVPARAVAPPANGDGGSREGIIQAEFVKITAPSGKPRIEFWRPGRRFPELYTNLPAEAFLSLPGGEALRAAGWQEGHFEAVGQEYQIPLNICWRPSPKNPNWKDVISYEMR